MKVEVKSSTYIMDYAWLYIDYDLSWDVYFHFSTGI
jgi:hypothetical protein